MLVAPLDATQVAELHTAGRSECRLAVDNYLAFTEKFGDGAWVNDDPIHTFSDGEVYLS